MRVTARVRAFTLVELLVVIAIIAILTSILLPVVGGARAAARRAATQSMVTDYTTAASRFANDNGDRMPGYFSEQEMGSDENYNSGQAFLSASENAMIDLAGQEAIWNDPDTTEPDGYFEVGPFMNGSARNIKINPDLIGADKGAYFTPGGSFFKSLDHGSQQISPVGRDAMPDVIDAFGNPVLVWSQDLGGRGSIDPESTDPEPYLQFARASSDGGDAWFYLYSNAAFLGNGAVGASGRNQGSDSMGDSPTSAIGLWTDRGPDFEEQARTLAAALGSPAYRVMAAGQDLTTAGYEDIFPARPRGRFVVQSAGRNGYYLGSDEQGWGTNAHVDSGEFHLDYGNTFKSQGGDRYKADDGGYTSIDLLDGFDDVLSSSGN